MCDDEQNVMEYVSNKLSEYYPNECEIKEYTNGESLLEDSRHEFFDAFFLDIGMPSLDGFEIAKQIRSNDSRVKIIFVTGKEEFAHMGYIYEAFRFVRKSKLDQELCETAKSLSKSLSLSDEILCFKSRSREILIDIKTIKYFKADGHSLILYGLNEERICGTMKELEDRLKNRDFIRIHKGYLVNFQFLYSIEGTSVKLSSGEELPISRYRVIEVKKRLHQYRQVRDEL